MDGRLQKLGGLLRFNWDMGRSEPDLAHEAQEIIYLTLSSLNVFVSHE